MALSGVKREVEEVHRKRLEGGGRAWSPEMGLLLAQKGAAGLMEEVCEDILEGMAFQSAATTRGLKQGELARWIMADEEREKEWEALLRVRSDLLMQETLGIVDGTDPEWVGVAKLRVDQRNKLAGKWYKARYGDESKVSLSVGGGSLVAILAALPVGGKPGERVIDQEDEVEEQDKIEEQEQPAIEGEVVAEPVAAKPDELLI